MASTQHDELTVTLYICREINVYKIPPRPAAGGHKSAEWKTADKIFTGRLRVLAKGDLCELHLEDPNNGELFAMCPVPLGQRNIAVEPVGDSSRYFVLRLVDPGTGRHAFLGMGFQERGEAFDFNVALSDHEKHVQRAKEVSVAKSNANDDSTPSNSGPRTDADALYKKQDLSLKQGETIRINVKKPAAAGGFLSQLGSSGRTSDDGSKPKLAPLAPPPRISPPAQAAFTSTTSGQPAAQRQSGASQPASSGFDLLGLDDASPAPVQAATQALEGFTPFGAKTTVTATSQDQWAAFD
ncbi:hypothetical protein WJX72_007270 [[Myrmecia] bisecta]|uniref:NECAP PHear domain-containing protein n=1 Tax=[Myrmecia] bisecta TaxID=41462 RepID=A0AAW1Q3Z5_9CHLO